MISPKVFYLQSLALEVEGTGVVIQEMDPGAVNTEMTKVGLVVMAMNIGDHDLMMPIDVGGPDGDTNIY